MNEISRNRDYGIRGTDIKIKLFDNRMVVLNTEDYQDL